MTPPALDGALLPSNPDGGNGYCNQHPQVDFCADFDDSARDEPEKYFANVNRSNAGTLTLVQSSDARSPPRFLVSSATGGSGSRGSSLLSWRSNKMIVEADIRVDEWDKSTGVGQAFSFVQNGVGIYLYVGGSSFLQEYRFAGGAVGEGKICQISGNPLGSKTWTHLRFELTTSLVILQKDGVEICRLVDLEFPLSTAAQGEIGFGVGYVNGSTANWKFGYDNIIVNPH